MPPNSMKQVIADYTDPATTRPNLELVIKTGSGFIPMDLPYFSLGCGVGPHRL
ncbi:uncharacterized protein RSE6_01973 [Rhynchosporium secalis]|uniref:Uncharacterized protein n=1 Tax=Rhynchosporium secalis TaxID=38038 RepID=A0A1E1LZ45_RHYSE|nr:uncharacterized protein RSE6_01973 [Rhynchosporium secalis]